jgi:hypothetical protein
VRGRRVLGNNWCMVTLERGGNAKILDV